MDINFFENGTKAKLKSKIEAELKNVKKQDLGKLDHNLKVEICEGNTKELKDVIEFDSKEKQPDNTIFSNNKKKAGEAK